MANLIRSAKSGSDWTIGDLDACIIIIIEDTATFFGIQELPPTRVDPEILSIQNAEDMPSDQNSELIALLDLAMSSLGPEDSAVDDFVVEFFKVLGYFRRLRIARTRKDIPFLICGKRTVRRTECLQSRGFVSRNISGLRRLPLLLMRMIPDMSYVMHFFNSPPSSLPCPCTLLTIPPEISGLIIENALPPSLPAPVHQTAVQFSFGIWYSECQLRETILHRTSSPPYQSSTQR